MSGNREDIERIFQCGVRRDVAIVLDAYFIEVLSNCEDAELHEVLAASAYSVMSILFDLEAGGSVEEIIEHIERASDGAKVLALMEVARLFTSSQERGIVQ